jgi:hypothetical protein
VQKLVQRVIGEHMKKFTNLTFMEIGFPNFGKVSLKLRVQYNSYDDFMRS